MARGNKYNAKKVVWDGKTFDSKRECYAYKLFKNLKIPFEWHVRYNLIPKFEFNDNKISKMDMVIDFIVDAPGRKIAVDIKGFATDVAKIKYKMLKYQQSQMIFKDYEEVIWLHSDAEINAFAFTIKEEWQKVKKNSSSA